MTARRVLTEMARFVFGSVWPWCAASMVVASMYFGASVLGCVAGALALVCAYIHGYEEWRT